MHNNISILSINKFIRLSLKIDGFFNTHFEKGDHLQWQKYNENKTSRKP